jgi:hypothetical protein
VGPKLGIGRPQYSSAAYALRFSLATVLHHFSNLAQALHSIIFLFNTLSDLIAGAICCGLLLGK